ncbi:MAG TPA: hypothetical protein PLA90_07545 [Candidatus Sumerlaeota bacterium]|nr:hypothetical protein [Candidatus Sumerlaeota bacterium]
MLDSWQSLSKHLEDTKVEKNGLEYLKLTPGKSKVRFAGAPVVYYGFFHEGRSYVCPQDLVASVVKVGMKPKQMIAAYCFDRTAGTADVKVLDKSVSFYSPIIEIAKETSIEPGAESAHEYLITTTGTGLATRYTVLPVRQTPYTPEEREAIKTLDMDALKRRYRSDKDREAIQDIISDLSTPLVLKFPGIESPGEAEPLDKIF